MSDSIHHDYMARALRLAALGLNTTDPNPRVGCVIVRESEIVGEGWHARAGEAHAEVNALRQAGDKTRGATAYVTLEPCSHFGKTPPCADALIDAGVARVVVGMRDPNPQVSGSGIERLRSAGIEVIDGVLEGQASALNPGFIKRMERGLPYVRLKMAASLDGQTAMACGESQWITGPDARQDVQRLRARSSAIMTGIGTVLADDPSLTVRNEPSGRDIESLRQPLRVVMDSQFRTPASAKMLSLPGNTLVVGNEDNAAREVLEKRGAQTLLVNSNDNGSVSLTDTLEQLVRMECNEVLIEAGSHLAGSLLMAGLVDELVLYLAPKLIGGDGQPLVYLPGLEHLRDSLQLQVKEVRSVGVDLRINAIVSPPQTAV